MTSFCERKSYPGTLDSLKPIRDSVLALAQRGGLSSHAAYRLSLAVDEIATNIAVHGYQEAKRHGTIDVTCRLDEHEVVVELEDCAAPYDPTQASVPSEAELLRPLDERPIGGLGVMLALRSTDEFRYHRVGDRNINVFIVKRGPKTAEG